jgi:hypothetical protein
LREQIQVPFTAALICANPKGAGMQPDIMKTEISAATERVIASALEEFHRIANDPTQSEFHREQQRLLIDLMPAAFRFLARREEMGASSPDIANEISCAFATVIDSLGMTLAQNDAIGGPWLLTLIYRRLHQARTGVAPPIGIHEAHYKAPGRA